jgi:DNA-binding NtrC family response regulator
VDDELGYADPGATYVEREDDRFDVETAPSMDERLEYLDAARFDCIVSDHNVPEPNGFEFPDAVRVKCSGLPFIFFTGKGSEEIASEAISTGVIDCLRKEGGTDRYAVFANCARNAVERITSKRRRHRQLHAIERAREGIGILDGEGTASTSTRRSPISTAMTPTN